ncbi:MAG: Trk system potassium transporter TrkA [Oscillospiraceae bacterium]|nr:Trk system potassium transporter TrkA [Oscillospiraceae bacterium]
MNIIIVGCGKVGSTIAKQLNAEGHNIVVVDNNPRPVEQITETLDVMGVEGNGATYKTLMEAGVKVADLLIAVTAADELNLYCCFIAKCIGNLHTIARVRNPEYTVDLPLLKEELRLSMEINPELTSAREMTKLLKFPGAIEIDTFSKGMVELIKIRIDRDSPLAGKKILETAKILKDKVKVCIVERGEEVFIPNGDFCINEGDKISVIVQSGEAQKVLKKLGIISGKSRNVIILGGSTTAYYLAKNLLQSGNNVKIIERNAQRCVELCEALPNATIINGDAMDEELLLSEGIEYANGIAALMDIDEENIIVSLYAKSVSKAKIITKINTIAFDSIISNLALDSVINPKHITGEYIVRYVRAMQNSLGSNVETLYKISDDKAEALEFRVREHSPVTDIPIKDLKLKDNLQIACINRQGKMFLPMGSDMIMLHDTVIVITRHKGLNDLKDILK